MTEITISTTHLTGRYYMPAPGTSMRVECRECAWFRDVKSRREAEVLWHSHTDHNHLVTCRIGTWPKS